MVVVVVNGGGIVGVRVVLNGGGIVFNRG